VSSVQAGVARLARRWWGVSVPRASFHLGSVILFVCRTQPENFSSLKRTKLRIWLCHFQEVKFVSEPKSSNASWKSPQNGTVTHPRFGSLKHEPKTRRRKLVARVWWAVCKRRGSLARAEEGRDGRQEPQPRAQRRGPGGGRQRGGLGKRWRGQRQGVIPIRPHQCVDLVKNSPKVFLCGGLDAQAAAAFRPRPRLSPHSRAVAFGHPLAHAPTPPGRACSACPGGSAAGSYHYIMDTLSSTPLSHELSSTVPCKPQLFSTLSLGMSRVDPC